MLSLFADSVTPSNPRTNRVDAKSLLRFGEIGSNMQSIDQMAARKSDANLKELKKKAPKTRFMFSESGLKST
jgi:hypothetical protein